MGKSRNSSLIRACGANICIHRFPTGGTALGSVSSSGCREGNELSVGQGHRIVKVKNPPWDAQEDKKQRGNLQNEIKNSKRAGVASLQAGQ